MRQAVASAMAAPGTDPESAAVASTTERAGEPAVAIARETSAIREPRPWRTRKWGYPVSEKQPAQPCCPGQPAYHVGGRVKPITGDSPPFEAGSP